MPIQPSDSHFLLLYSGECRSSYKSSYTKIPRCGKHMIFKKIMQVKSQIWTMIPQVIASLFLAASRSPNSRDSINSLWQITSCFCVFDNLAIFDFLFLTNLSLLRYLSAKLKGLCYINFCHTQVISKKFQKIFIHLFLRQGCQNSTLFPRYIWSTIVMNLTVFAFLSTADHC